MARALRTDFPGAVHHVTSRGNERRPIFFDDRDREMFLTFLGEAVQRFGWSLTAFVLMTNHFHLLIQTPERSLSRGMRWPQHEVRRLVQPTAPAAASFRGRPPDRSGRQCFGRTLAVNDCATIRPSRITKVSVASSYTLSGVSAFQRM